MSKESTENKTQALLREAQKRLELAMEAEGDNRQKALEDLEFIAIEGAQWPAAIRAMRESDDRPCLSINKMPTYLDQVVGDQRMNRPSVKVVPVDSKADPEVARILGGWIKHVQQVSKADVAIDNAFEHAVASGYGALRVVTKYVSDFSFDQEAYIQVIENALAVFFGPHEEYDCSDAMYCFIITDLPRDEYRQKYKLDPMPFNKADSRFVEGWATKDTVRVAEYFVKEPVTKTLYELADGTLTHKLAEGQSDLVVRKRRVDTYKIKWYLISGDAILEESDWMGKKYIPVIPVWGKQLNVGGRKVLRGLIRNGKDPQRMLNYWNPLSLNTPIPTPTGWKLLGNIEIGDEVFDESGCICTVTNVSPTMYQRDCYEITFDDGSSIVADSEHRWAVLERGKRTAKGIQWQSKVVTTSELDPSNHVINVTEPLNTPDQDLPIHPYLLGVWLGDGASIEPNITQGATDAAELFEYIRRLGFELGDEKPGINGAINRTVLGVRSKFTELNLLGNKHIPYQYLRGSYEQRLELLQGLMDTDGSINAVNGSCEFTTTNASIASMFCELLRSLGIKAKYVIRDRKEQKFTKPDGTSYVSETSKAAQFYFTTRLPVFKLYRKLRYIGAKKERSSTRSKRFEIISILPTESVPVKCITVNSKNALFLAGKSMVPTHNSVDTETIALQPKTPFLVTPAQIAGHESQWKLAHKQSFPYLLVNPDTKAPGWPKREAPPQASSAFVTKIQQTDQDIRDTIGLQKAALGMQSNERSGAAIRERKMEGDVGTFAFADNLSRSIEHLGRVLIDLAPGILDTRRIIRLGLDNGEFEHVEVNVPTGEKDETTGEAIIGNNMQIGTYDIVVTVGPSFTTQRAEARQSMSEFIQYVPDVAPLIIDLYAKNMDWPGAEEFAERLEYLLPPEVRAQKAAKAAQGQGASASPPTEAPAPQNEPSPEEALNSELAMIKLQEAKMKLEQEKAKLAGLLLINKGKMVELGMEAEGVTTDDIIGPVIEQDKVASTSSPGSEASTETGTGTETENMTNIASNASSFTTAESGVNGMSNGLQLQLPENMLPMEEGI